MNRITLVHVDTLSCEPILRRAPDGDLVCVAQTGGVTEPAPENRVHVFRSSDDGQTWSRPVSIYPEDGSAVYVTELAVRDGVMTAYLTLHAGRFLDWRCVMMVSRDGGHTWQNAGSPPHLPTFTFFRGTIETSDGRIVLPYQHYPITQERNDRLIEERGRQAACWDAGAPYVENGVLVSEDRGASFERHVASRVDLAGGWIWSEPTVVELGDGTLSMLQRPREAGWLWRCDSTDGGRTWGELQETDIPNPSNKPKLVAIPGGRIALIHTPNNQGRPGAHPADLRHPLSVWISDDDMRTWGYRQAVTTFPGQYCYPDGFHDDGHIKFTIEYNRHDILFVDHRIIP